MQSYCACMYGCIWMLFVSNIVKEMKGKFLLKFILNKKSLGIFDQFVSMAEREIDII